MITYYFKTLKDSELKELDAPRKGVWVHADTPSERERAQLVELFGLDAAIIEDAMDFFEVPRYEHTDGVSYFFTRYPYDDTDEDIDTAPILIAIGETFVLTVVLRTAPFLEPVFKNVLTVQTTQKGKLFIQIMRLLTDAYEGELVRMRRAVHRDRIRLRAIRARDIERLVKYEHTLNDVISALVPTNTWLRQVEGHRDLVHYEEDGELVNDLLIANGQVIDSAKSILKNIQNVRSASEAILTNALNSTMRLLAALTVLLTIPTIVASLYGMNVPLPLSNQEHAFWIILSWIAGGVAVAAFFFVRNRWL